MNNPQTADNLNGLEIAVIGMTGRFPGADDLEQFWQNLAAGIESIGQFNDDELTAAGISPEQASDPHYVPAGGVLRDVELFDAAFFGFYPKEAEILDPQQRIFLESAWQALEDAGYDPEQYPGAIGVYAGSGMNSYLLVNLMSNRAALGAMNGYQVMIGNDKDFMPTRVSYKLNLRGPSVNIQTACSTSLVAVHLACQSLLSFQCDMALAGGITVRLPQQGGYLYEEGGILSPDGHCRAFDENAAGTVTGNGVGVVVLKRLADALADGDNIRAVIKASAINNDGAQKVGYTAPSVDGQSEVIATAQSLAGVEPESISYIEAHGTGTAMGDPIEITALTQVFRAGTERRQFCAIGSLKPNVGHLDTAAGVAGLIKTVLSLENQQIPPSINYTRPNPRIDFANSPFYVNDQLSAWQTAGGPRRAGVSSFGIGGTNAHVIVEEAPARRSEPPMRDYEVLLLSARTPTALDQATQRLGEHLSRHPEQSLADVAYTLQVGRRAFAQRRMLVCSSREDAIIALQTLDPQRLLNGSPAKDVSQRPVAFLFSGQGSQYANMARDLYAAEPTVRQVIDQCSELLLPELNLDLRSLLFPAAGEEQAAAEQLGQTSITQPALFVIEYALAQLWMEWGMQPQAMLGHSIGEYVAACLAGVFSLPDALRLVATRGRLMQRMPAGSMLSVNLPEAELRPLLGKELAIAAINAPNLCVASGPHAAIEALQTSLQQRGITCRRLHTSHAFHSPMMEPILGEFTRLLRSVKRNAPKLPFVSNVSGTWISEDEATDPNYWARHLRGTVRFAEGVRTLLEDPSVLLLEVGPGQSLTTLARQIGGPERSVLPSLRHPNDKSNDHAFLLSTLGKLWMAGVVIDWSGVHRHSLRQRVSLPGYPFERQRYWIEARAGVPQVAAPSEELRKRSDINSWFYAPSWRRIELSRETITQPARCLILADQQGLAEQLAAEFELRGGAAVLVRNGASFARHDAQHYTINPAREADYERLLADLRSAEMLPETIAHLWNVELAETPQQAVLPACDSLLMLARVLGRTLPETALRLGVVSSGLHEVTGVETLRPATALLNGVLKVIPQEYPQLSTQSIDLEALDHDGLGLIARRLVDELSSPASESELAYRGRYRWARRYEALRVDPNATPRLRNNGVYLITGGTGRIGLTLAAYLAQQAQATLVLVSRSGAPRDAARLAQIAELEALGAQVVIERADVADLAQMSALVERTVARFGPINGVIHAAGFVGEESLRTIQDTDAAHLAAHLTPKLDGLLVLDAALRKQRPDFCIACSSLSAVLGGLGMAAYAAANGFMDAFALQRSQAGAPQWTSVDWDGWRFEDDGRHVGTAAELSMTPAEGVQAFARLLTLGEQAQVVVSTAELELRTRRSRRTLTQTTTQTETQQPGSLYARPNLATRFVAPSTELEREIATLWQAVLGIEQIGVHDDFFELGGHSLLATQLISRLRDTYGVELPLRRMFEQPTVAGLAALIEEARPTTATAAPLAPGIPRVSREQPLPLSFGQQRLWFLDQLEPGSPLYNNAAALRLGGTLDAGLLERSLNEVIRRHEVLRTTYGADNGKPVQLIHAELPVQVGLIDLRTVAPEQLDAEVRRLALEEANIPFNLETGPLLRATLLQLHDDENVLLFTMHHIVSDGWSTGVLIGEALALYDAYRNHQPSPLPELTLQYADYAAWQREWLQGEQLQQQLDYWKRQLGGDLAALDLPADYPRPSVQTYNGAMRWFSLSPQLSEALVQFSKRENVTLFMTLLAAFQTLLHRYSNQDDISIGSPIAGRNRAETEALIGFFINTLVLRGDLSGNPSFRELLGRAREISLGAYAHQDLPFELIVDALQPARDMSRTPLFQVMFVLQNSPMPRNTGGLQLAPMEIDSGLAKFDLTLCLEEGADGLRGWFNYNSDLFAAETIARMQGHLEVLLEAILANPEARLAELPILTAAEREQILNEWNATANGATPAEPVYRQFERQAARAPQAIAALCDERSLSYGALNARANELAHYLRGLGVRPEQPVAVYLERSLESLIAMLAIWKAGGAYLPLDPAYPQDRLQYMLQDSGAKVVITTSLLSRSLPARGFELLRLDGDEDLIAQEPTSNLQGGAKREQLAYIIYTSGSTGTPKGVPVEHGTLADHSRDMAVHFGYTPQDAMLQFASLNFDASIEQIVVPLISGARVVLRGKEVWTAAEFITAVRQYAITVINPPTAYWHQLIEEWLRRDDPVTETVRLVIVGGDLLRPESLDLWQRSSLRKARLMNAYGPTETTITALTYEVPPMFIDEDAFHEVVFKRVPIGRPLANRSAYVLDRHGNPVPVGVPGELCLGGQGMARGYLNRPDLTADRFVTLALSDTTRVYRTGDMVRYLPDGNLEFLGRLDAQVKIRGFRIELGEIETALTAHDAVREAIVLAREDQPGQKRLVAYLLINREPLQVRELGGSNGNAAHTAVMFDEPALLAELRAMLKQRLPEYMVPAAFVLLEAWPMTPGGKVNRRALPAPDAAQQDAATYVAPRTPVEIELAQVWAEVLGVERIGIYDNFFELGGHSLLATQLASRIRAIYGVEAPLRKLFEHPTVAGLAVLLAQSQAEQVADDDELARMLAELEGLSDDEVQDLLAREIAGD